MKPAIFPILLALFLAALGATARIALADPPEPPPVPAASAGDGHDRARRAAERDCDENSGIFAPEVIGPLVSIPATFGTTFAIIIAALVYRYRRERQRLETVRYLSDKGHDVPIELLAPTAKVKRNTDLRRGLVLLLGGGGLSISLAVAHQIDSIGFGLIPGLIGLAFLVVWKVERAQAAAGGVGA